MTTSIRSGANDSSLQVNGVDSLNFNSGGAERKLESVTCTQSGGALTFTLNPTVMSMRSATLTSGVPQTVIVNSAVTLTLPSGGTLGFPTTVQGRIYAVLMSNGELAIVSAAGGNDLSETGVISTTAISAGSTANNVFYSTTARTGLTYRVVGAVDVVNTAGAWGNPVLVQGAGGLNSNIRKPTVAVSAYQSTLQSLTSTISKIQFQTKEFDTGNYFDATTNYRFQPLVAGYYQVISAIQVIGITNGLVPYIYKNGSSYKIGATTTVATTNPLNSVECLVFLNGTTDYIEVWASSVSTLNTNNSSTTTYLQAILVSAL